MKRRLLLFGILMVALLFSCDLVAQRIQHTVRRVVIDAGHGGLDPGAVGKKSKEKDIALAIAMKTGKYIEENLKDVEVIYTRRTDEFIELFRRAQIANDSKADLFISIHCNAARSAEPYGAETFVMGLHKNQENLEVAKKENSAILLEEGYQTSYNGFDPNSPEAHVIFSLYQNAYLEQSLDFSKRVQEQFLNRMKLNDRGVKQAGFLVLHKIAMPGVLIETGFISNPKEEAFLSSNEGQGYIASAIYRAFKEYKESVEKAGQVQQLTKAKTEIETVNKAKPDAPVNPQGSISFRVQFFSSATDKSLHAPEFSKLKTVRKYKHQGSFKFTVGDEKTLEAAIKLKEEMLKKGFSDSFVVAFLNEERLPVDAAIKIQQQRK